MRRFVIIGLTVFFIISGVSFTAWAASPMEAVRGTIDGVLDVLRKKELSVESKAERILPIIRERFDFRAMSQRALGKNWKKATRQEKDRFVELFSDLLESAYVSRIELYSNQRVEYGQEKINGKRAVVNTVFVTAKADIPINYKVYLKGDAWYVYDVVIEEVSLIRNYRSSYGEIVQKDGIDGLLAALERKRSTKEATREVDERL